MKQVIYHGAERVLYGKKGGAIVWPTRTQDLASEQRDRIKLDPIFTADIQTKGLRNYAERNPSGMVRDTDYGVCAAPDGSGDVVVWTDNSRHLSNGNEYQRSQLQTPQCIAPVAHTEYPWGNDNSVYVEYAKVWIEDKYPFGATSQWINFFEPHGSPYIGSSAMGIMLVWSPSAGYHLRLGNDPTYLGTTVPFKLGQWVQIARQYKYEYAENGGWGDLWYNLSGDLTTGWVRAKINGGYRLPLDVIRKDANGNRVEGGGWVDSPIQLGGSSGMTHSKLGLYGNVYSVMYWADHRVGRTFKNTMPDGWSPAAFGGFDPDTMWPPAPPFAPVYTPVPTGGTGGPLTDRRSLSYTDSGGLTSSYHLYAAGLDWSKSVGLMIYADGTGEYGLKNPDSTYLMAGTDGIAAVAKRQNMLLLTPAAPGSDQVAPEKTQWYLPSGSVTVAQKNRWARELITMVESQYNVDKSRVAVGGYSSGAEWTTRAFIPRDAQTRMSAGVAVGISYGGKPLIPTSWEPGFPSRVFMVWDYGDNPADGYGEDAAKTASEGGEAWYRGQGFSTEMIYHPGQTHTGRPTGEFGRIMERAIRRYVRPA